MIPVGRSLTVTDVVTTDAEQPAFVVMVTLYTPAAAGHASTIEGFCKVELNPSGPDHK